MCLAARRRSAGSSFAIDRCAWKPAAIARWKTWRHRLLDCRAAEIEQKDAAATSTSCLFYDAAYGFKNRFQRTALGSHFQNEILSGEQAFRALSLIDIRLQNAPTEDASVRVPHREPLHTEPPVDAIGAPLTEFKIIRLATFE